MNNLSDRMKNNYESIFRYKLVRRMPVIIRLDGKCFHSLTRNLSKPFDEFFRLCMSKTAIKLCKEVQNTKLAYIQSDEISLLLVDYTNINTNQWFDGNIQKIVSISSAIASVEFSNEFEKKAYFDSRVFNIPKEEVCNYFIWRQKDAIRNSILSLGQKHFSHNQLYKLNCNEILYKLRLKGINWDKIETKWRRGFCIIKEESEWKVDLEIPLFTDNRYYIERYINLKENKNEINK